MAPSRRTSTKQHPGGRRSRDVAGEPPRLHHSRKKHHMKRVLGDRRAIAILLGPALLVYTLVMLVPVMWSLGLHLLRRQRRSSASTFVGLDNFVQLFDDPTVPERSSSRSSTPSSSRSAGRLGYLLALLYVFVLKRASGLVRTLVFFPVVLPTVAVALLFQQLFEIAPQNGLVNDVPERLRHRLASTGSATRDSAFVVIVIMDIWRSMGFYAVLLYAGLVDIPEDVLESARLDGATGGSSSGTSSLPLSLPVLLSSVIFSINGTLKVFDSVLALTNGGPGNATTPLTLYMFQTSFTYGEYGYGSTIALVLTILCLVVTLFIFRSSRRDLTKLTDHDLTVTPHAARRTRSPGLLPAEPARRSSSSRSCSSSRSTRWSGCSWLVQDPERVPQRARLVAARSWINFDNYVDAWTTGNIGQYLAQQRPRDHSVARPHHHPRRRRRLRPRGDGVEGPRRRAAVLPGRHHGARRR